MWIVNVALKRPYTFIVMAILILLATPFVLFTTPVDVLPEINIPVVSIIWTYTGLSAEDMANRITSVNERSLTTTVNDIEHIESQSLAGIAILKVFLQPNANIQTAIAQTVAVEQAQLKQMPPGATPPLVISYSASSIPVIQLGLSSPKLSEQSLNDTALNFLRPQLVTIPGAAVPYPYGGKSRLISVDLDTRALLAKGLTPSDVVSAFNAQNLILPTGTAKIGPKEYTINMNGSPATVEGLNDIPVRTLNGATTYLREVAHVRDGFSPQTNIVRQNGHRGVLMSVLKNGSASTLSIVDTLQRPAAGRARRVAAGPEHHRAVRPVGVREGGRAGRGARGADRRRADRRDDPAVPRQLAQHLHHRDLDSAVDSVVADRAARARADHQHHDARRSRAGGRDSGRRCDGDDREYRTASAYGHESARCDSRRRGRNRGSRAGVDAVYLYRVRADVLPDRRRALSVRAARRSGGVRDARVVHSVAYAGADAGDAADGSRAQAESRARSRICSCASIGASTAVSSACAPATS